MRPDPGRVTNANKALSTSSPEPPQAVAKPEPVSPDQPASPTVRALLPVSSRSRATTRPSSNISPQVAELARTVTRNSATDRDKAHAIYRWLGENIAYDVAALDSGNLGNNDPSTVLKRKKAVCAGYADLFDQMCRSVGLESEVVVGRSRSEEQQLPAILRNSPTNHAWNAVKLGGEWRLLDPTWGAGNVDRSRRFVKDPNDDWFLVDPEVFSYTHLPQDEKWQLLDLPLDRETFDRRPMIKPEFFALGLSLVEPEDYELTRQGEMVLRARSEKGYHLSAMVESGGTQMSPNTSLTRRIGKEYIMSVRFPASGDYQVHIMARPPGSQRSEGVAKFKVTSNGGKPLFPEAYLHFYEHDCEIVKGTNGTLRAGEQTTLKFRVPGAARVFLNNASEQLEMRKSGEIFTAQITPKRGEVRVAAQLDPASRKLPVLLSYRAK